MHGVRKSDRPKTPEELAAEREKISAYQEGLGLAMQLKAGRVFDEKSLLITKKILLINPDYYSLWNFRREVLDAMFPGQQLLTRHLSFSSAAAEEENDDEDDKTEEEDRGLAERLAAAREEELSVSQDAIARNPKSYCSWFHRAWALRVFPEPDIQRELALCARFLDRDQRNFHCWNFRRALVRDFGLSLEGELAFALSKVSENFSNYSAFHHRSLFVQPALQEALAPCGSSLEDRLAVADGFLEAEFEVVTNALYTEPQDQSAWWYQRFLFAWLSQHLDSGSGEGVGEEGSPLLSEAAFQALLEGQCEHARELVDLEVADWREHFQTKDAGAGFSVQERSCRLPLLMLFDLLTSYPRLLPDEGERTVLFETLCAMEPSKRAVYESMRDRVV